MQLPQFLFIKIEKVRIRYDIGASTAVDFFS